MKRIFDFIASLVGLVLLSPFILILSSFLLIFNGWPVFFIQPRLGKDKIPFNMIKFRTMKKGNSKSSEDDAIRQTRFGKILRKTSLDELPVLINVVKGNMSLVGPRPLLLKYKNRFTNFQDSRHNVIPGITGLAQIKGRNEISWEKKFEYDIQYIEQRSFLLDLRILFRTIFSVLLLKNTSPSNQDIMPEFMGTDNERKKPA
ncbi:MAG: sugar transferase [Candidatus Marinimicrobia bacterium]|jgi:lipopolysaccharide/colanic/teichoic acid biosynthesis glycosyltransferase|nr:sugar transferase [Candidatus Neomarinimicrobiota bacterium]MBT5070392.1 sugar transferase [Candidatus Neomarinimicrobiota bacterium]MBT5758446.1 sugar transferase [Candidatus Neomarinimicrobiota bacterium]MBT6469634.1 sugar transferase [Candidatus Neomarinimicrobiota bacterium]MBT6936016.1 sugar transferase [Candidatus Neomarinimicrobiota bacterium]